MLTRATVMFLSFIWFVGVAASAVAETRADKTKRLIEGAKKEGEVVIWHIAPLTKNVLKPFKKKYPFLTVKDWRHRGPEGSTKAIEEAKAGMHNHDLTILGPTNMAWLLRANLLAEYDWPNTKGWVNQPDHNFFRSIVASAKVPVFNTSIIPKAEWPRTWEDLKDPKWRGKTIASSSGEDTALYTAYLWRKNDRELNWERSFKYWSEVIKATKPKIARGFGGPTELVATGVKSIMIWTLANSAQRAIWKGAPIKLLPVKHLVAGNNPFAIMKRAPHPNAARLFADYLTSKEGLLLYADSRAVLVNSPELRNFTRGNKHLAELGFTFDVFPQWVVTDENIQKAASFWISELGIKKKKRARRRQKER